LGDRAQRQLRPRLESAGHDRVFQLAIDTVIERFPLDGADRRANILDDFGTSHVKSRQEQVQANGPPTLQLPAIESATRLLLRMNYCRGCRGCTSKSGPCPW